MEFTPWHTAMKKVMKEFPLTTLPFLTSLKKESNYSSMLPSELGYSLKSSIPNPLERGTGIPRRCVNIFR